jgi:hypothetical protein
VQYAADYTEPEAKAPSMKLWSASNNNNNYEIHSGIEEQVVTAKSAEILSSLTPIPKTTKNEKLPSISSLVERKPERGYVGVDIVAKDPDPDKELVSVTVFQLLNENNDVGKSLIFKHEICN